MTARNYLMTYSTHPIYRILTLVCLLFALLFIWELRNGLELDALFFLAVAGGLALYNGRLAASRVELTTEAVQLHQPLTHTRRVEFRQLSEVHEEGRGSKSILLLYHPRQPDGLFVLDELQSLALPNVTRQDELLDTLTVRVPL